VKIQQWTITPLETKFTTGLHRFSYRLHLVSVAGSEGFGEIAPWDPKIKEIALKQLEQTLPLCLQIAWSKETMFQHLQHFNLLPSVLFGLESALLAILDPACPNEVITSALLMGSPEEILRHAELRFKEGYKTAKLKVGNLTFLQAETLIQELSFKFRLRIDVNRAWTSKDSLAFFAKFPLDAFDYVEEPFDNPQELAQFSHPLAIDESFPKDLSIEEIQKLPTFKCLVYKPSIQGGYLHCIPLLKKKIPIVLSSSFESFVGLHAIKEMAHRLQLQEPAGLGTCHYAKNK
jgi:O-succinylbenzoate synthase